MTFTVETEQESDGRWIAEILQIPGAMAYGGTRDEAVARVEALGLRVPAERSTDYHSRLHLVQSPQVKRSFKTKWHYQVQLGNEGSDQILG